MELFQHFWYSICLLPLIKVLLKRIYGLEDDDVWRKSRWLCSARQSLICNLDDISYFWVCMLPEAFHQFSAQEDIRLGRRCWWKKQNGCLVLGNLWYLNRMISAFSESPCCRKPSIKFLLKRIYGLEEVIWKMPWRLFSAWPSSSKE